MYMTHKFIADAKRIKNNIDFINNVLTGLIHSETTVEITNQTPVCIEYNVTAPEYTGHIVFDGSIVRFSDPNIEMEKFGYMKLKLNVLRRGLDKKIKTNAKMAARAKKHDALVMALKSRLSEHLLGRGGL